MMKGRGDGGKKPGPFQQKRLLAPVPISGYYKNTNHEFWQGEVLALRHKQRRVLEVDAWDLSRRTWLGYRTALLPNLY